MGCTSSNKWDRREAFEACKLDAVRLRQCSELPSSVRLDSFASAGYPNKRSDWTSHSANNLLTDPVQFGAA